MKSRITILILCLFALSLKSCDKDDESENEFENEAKVSFFNGDDSHYPGQNCMNCHKKGSQGEGWFIVAGTVYDSLKTAIFPNPTMKLYSGINGSGDLIYTLQGDAFGNFFSTDKIDFINGLYPSIQGSTEIKHMISPIFTGECNSCHGVTTEKIFVK